MAHLAIERLTKVFRSAGGESVRAVDRASLAIEDGELLVIVGPSGCGKTTLLRLIAGLEEPTEGNVAIDGVVMNHVSAKDRDIAMVFQGHALYPHLSAYDNLALGLTLRRCSKTEIEQRVRKAAELLDLSACLQRFPHELSGGQRQRVAVGRAIVRQPKLFLFDEPLSDLDLSLRTGLRMELASLHARLGATMLYVTHDQIEALTMGRRVAVMKEGRIQQVADPVALYQNPANLFVAGFIGSPPMNLFRGTLAAKDGGLSFAGVETVAGPAGWGISLPLAPDLMVATAWIGREVVLGIRPEDLALAELGSPAAECVPALAETTQFAGSEWYVRFRSGSHRFIVRTPASVRVSPGEKCSLHFQMRAARLFDAATGNAIPSERLSA